MSKKRGPYNFGAGDLFGGQSVKDDPLYQEAMRAEQALEMVNPLGRTTSLKSEITPLQYEIEEYKRYLDGDYSGTAEEIDYRLGEKQSTIKQLWNGFGRLLPLTALKFVGTANSLKVAIDNKLLGNEDAFDNELGRSVQEWEDSLKAAMPIYATRKYDGDTLLEQMGTAKFWADDAGDGVAFLAAQILGTKGLGAVVGTVGKGASYLAKGVEGVNLLSKVPASAKIANYIANNYKVGTVALANSGYTGAMQAQDTFEQIKTGLNGKVNPNTNETYTDAEVRAIASEHAANTFNSTFLVHILPAIYESKIFLGMNKAKLGDIRASVMEAVNKGELKIADLFTGVGETALVKSVGKQALKGFGKGAAIEGLWEENIEQSIQNYDIQQGLNDKNTGISDRYLNYAMGMLDNLGVKEDAKAVVLGAILGGPMGAFSKYGSAKNFNEKMPQYLNSLRASEAQYQEDIKSIYKTHPEDVKNSEGNVSAKKGSLVFDDQGQPIENIEALKNLTFQALNQKNQWDRQTVATLTGNSDMVGLNENMALSSAVFRELDTVMEDDGDTAGALDFLKWRLKQQLTEQEEEQKAITDEAAKNASEVATDESAQGEIEAQQAATKAKSESATFNGKERAELSRVTNASIAKIDTFADNFKQAQRQAKSTVKLGQSKERTAFSNIIQKGLYYEAIKRSSFDDMIADRKEQLKDPLANIEKITAEINKITELKNDSLEKSKAYLNSTDEVYKSYAKPRERFATLIQQANDTIQKLSKETDLTKRADLERQKATLAYQAKELAAHEGLDSSLVTNEEVITERLSTRVAKPIGMRNNFFWKAGNDFASMEELNKKINDYEQNKLTLTDVINYAKESITYLDKDTARRLYKLIDAEREVLAATETQLANTDDFLPDEQDSYGNERPGGLNPVYQELVNKQQEITQRIKDAEQVLSEKEEASEMNLINQEPQNIERYLVQAYAQTYFEKGQYIIDNVIDSEGNISEDYRDSDSVEAAINELIQMRNALQDRSTDGDLQGMSGIAKLISDADNMLVKLNKIREQVAINKPNWESRQNTITKSEVKLLSNGLGFTAGAITDETLFNLINNILDGILLKELTTISGWADNQYEGMMSLFHKIQQKAETKNQLKAITDQLDLNRKAATAVLKSLLPGNLAVSKDVIKAFGTNPRQVFAEAWLKISSYSKEGRISNVKNSLYNKFLKNNDADALLQAANLLPDNTKELGMPKADFIKFVEAYRQALAAEKIEKLLSTAIKPVVQSELKNAPAATLVPTAEQEISIREGIGWLKRPIKIGKAFSNWAFLRGRAGTGKSSIIIPWMLDNSGINKANVYTTSIIDNAAKVIQQSTGAQGISFEKLEAEGLPEGAELLIIDEYAAVGSERLSRLEKSLREKGVKVLILGDPTQITPNTFANTDLNSIGWNPNAGNIEIINPVTVVYRSNVPSVEEASSIFEDNNIAVDSPTVRSDQELGKPLASGVQVSSSSEQILDIIRMNQQVEEANKTLTPRTRAIIVGRKEDAAKYNGLLGVTVMTVYDSMSQTFDEVYVDIPKVQFPDVKKYNTAIYTALSRAKVYSFLTYPKGKNVVDSSVKNEYDKNITRLQKMKESFIKAKTEELSMMDSKEPLAKAKKTAKKESEDAGKSTLDIEVEDLQTEETSDVVAITEDEDSDEPIDSDPEGMDDPVGTIDSDPPPIPEGVVRQSIDHVDKEAYMALKKGVNPDDTDNEDDPIKAGDGVIYLYTEGNKGQTEINIFAKSENGNWVKVGKVFQEEFTNDKFADIKLAGKKPFHISETDQLNGRRKGGVPYTYDELAPYIVRQGRISHTQYLRFLYNKGLQNIQDSTLAEHIGAIFTKLWPKDKEKTSSVIFKIFTKTELSKKGGYDGPFKLVAGIPYAIVGKTGVSYKGTMAVRLQANRLEKTDPQVTELKKLAVAVSQLEEKTKIYMGTPEFNKLIRVFRDSLEVKEEESTIPEEGTVFTVVPKSNYTEEDVIAATRALADVDENITDEDLFKNVDPDEDIQGVITLVQQVASQLYGYDLKKGEFTAEQIATELGTEYEWEGKEGQELGFAHKVGGTRYNYKMVPTLDASKGRAQIALNQLAKANAFVGNKKIRVNSYVSKNEKAYTGKSLITASSGKVETQKVLAIRDLYINYIAGPKMIEAGKLNEEEFKTAEGRAIVNKAVKSEAVNSLEGPYLFMKNKLAELEDEKLDREVEEIDSRRETPPITLETLQLITGDENFDDAGSHMTEKEFSILDRHKQPKTQQTHLRKPLQIHAFNKMGENPVEHAEELSRWVNTSFDGVLPTSISVDIDGQIQSVQQPVDPELPSEDGDTDSEIARLQEELEAEVEKENPDETQIKKLFDRIQVLNDRDSLPFDRSEEHPDPGKKINIEEAVAELQRMIPGIIEGQEYAFLNRTAMLYLANPGEDLLGLFDKSKIFLQQEEGYVYEGVLRHEVMHKIYYEYLSRSEKSALRNALDPRGEMTLNEFDEALADRFMVWKKGEVKELGFIEKIFQKILEWFNFYGTNRDAIQTIFQNIEDGKYTKKVTAVSDVRRAFSKIRQNYDNTTTYNQAVKMVQGVVLNSVMKDDLNTEPITMSEAKEYVRNRLLAKKQTATGTLKTLELMHAKLGKKLGWDQRAIADNAAQLNILNKIFAGDSKVFDDLWGDIYTNYKFKSGEGISNFEDSPEEDSEESKTVSSILDFTKQSDEVNSEGKVVDNVKNFLSFIFRAKQVKDKDTDEPATVGERINPRYVYLEVLRTLNGLITGEGDLKESIREAAKANGINIKSTSDGRLIIDRLLNLIDDATLSTYTDSKGNTVKLQDNTRFVDENTFYSIPGLNITDETNDGLHNQYALHQATPGTYQFNRLKNEGTPAFIKRIVAGTGMSKNTVIAHFKQTQAQETMREVMSHFTSQREGSFMIAESARIGKMANSHTELRYMTAQLYGAERVIAADLENVIRDKWLTISPATWAAYDSAKGKNTKVPIILKALGLKSDTGSLNLQFMNNLEDGINGFRERVENAYTKGANGKLSPNKLKKNEDDDPEDEVQVTDVEYLLKFEESLIKNLTRLLSKNSPDARPGKYRNVKGSTQYSFHNSSQALEVIQRLINITGTNWINPFKKQKGETDEDVKYKALPAYLRTPWGRRNIFVDGKLNQIHELKDHDGMRNEGLEKFSKGYSEETNSDNWQRQLAYGFLAYSRTNTNKSNPNLKYIQYFWTISNRPRIVGAEVNLLREKEVRQAAHQMLLQHLESSEQVTSVKNFDANRFKTINMEEMGKAIDTVMKESTKETYSKLKSTPELQEKVLDEFEKNLKVLASEVADRIVKEEVVIGDDAGKIATAMKQRGYLLKDTETLPGTINQTRGKLDYTKEGILPIVEQWVYNNYVNGYFLNQIPVGNFNYFTDANDLIKRLSSIFGPGTKGLIGKYFMRPSFKVAVMNDPILTSEELSEILQTTALKEAAALANDGKGFDLADGQGFRRKSRSEEVSKGFGKSYGVGAVLKPVIYTIEERTTGEFAPVLIKYSSVELSDDLINKFPKLKQMDVEMERLGVDELVFNSSMKEGQPSDNVQSDIKPISTKSLEIKRNVEIMSVYKSMIDLNLISKEELPDKITRDITVKGKKVYKGVNLGTEDISRQELLVEQNKIKNKLEELKKIINCL